MEFDSLPIIFSKGARRKETFFYQSIFTLQKKTEFLHYHDVLELGVCLSGSGRYVTVGGEIPFCEGDVQVIQPFRPHYNVSDDGGCVWTFIDIDVPRISSPHVSIEPAYMLELSRTTAASGIFTARNAPHITSLVHSIVSLIQSESCQVSPISDLIAAKTGALLLELSAMDGGGTATADGAKRTEIILPAIQLASEALEKGEKIRPCDMASACFMSESYFRKLFTGIMGEPPKNYLSRLQTQKAATLLATTTLPIAKIARLTCFEDNSTFYRRFIKAYGQSPTEYREGVANTKTESVE